MDGDPDGDRSRTDPVFGPYGGVVVAALGFGITRFFVVEAVALSGAPVAVIATVGSLTVGLSLTVAGVALAVGAFERAYVADVSRGSLVGAGVMTAALAVTVAATEMTMAGEAVGTQLLAANVLLGGAIGGFVNGHRKASLRSRRETIARGANQARFINRLLRHEVLNAATIIDGHAELLRGDGSNRDRSVDAIRRGASRIESTVNGVGTIAEDRETGAVRPSDAVRSAIDRIDGRETGSDGGETGNGGGETGDGGDGDAGTALVAADRVDVDLGAAGAVDVAADDRLAVVFERLIEHAIAVRGAERVTVDATVDRHAVTLTLADDGTPLSATQRSILERGAFPEYDDPTNGFALQAAALLVGEYGGRIRVEDGESVDEAEAGEGGESRESRVTVRLRRVSDDAAAATVGVPFPALRRGAVAGLVAGVVMGGIYRLTSGVLPVIGALYGVESLAVGWITHLFHSVVFALLFLAGASTSPLRERIDGAVGAGVAGLGWGAVLWLVAAGVVMPLWLRAVGQTAALPNLPPVGLLAHAVWGASLGLCYVLIGGRFD